MAYTYEFPHSTQFDSDLREIIELFIQLKGLPVKMDELEKFVKNYFSNLDVQSEINKKLDDMNTDGTLDKIINEEIFGELNNKLNINIQSVDELNNKLNINIQSVGELNNKLNINIQSVNVKAFGATGDGLTDDTNALDAALEYAELHGIHTIFFPDGTYNLPNRRYVIDTSKQAWIGENVTKLKSSGLVDGAFITLTSPLSLTMYDYARVPLSNICLEGVYNDDSANLGVNGISYGDVNNPGTTMVSPHLAIYNVTVKNFNTGIYLASSYKSSAYNLNIIACNYGLYIGDGGIVPWNCYCCHIECCYIAIYSLADGYAESRFFGGAFEYNRIVFNGYGRHTFVGVRFEFDLLAACNRELVTHSVFNLASPSSGYLKFTDCSFLLLPNFELNVIHWLPNPYKASVNNNSVFYAYSSSYYGKCQIMLENCEIATDGETQYPGNGNYIINGQKIMLHHNVYYGTSENIVNTIALVEENNGFVV